MPRRPSNARSVRVEHRAADGARPALEIRSSTRRTKTATAWWEGATLIVALPARVKGAEREELVEWLLERSSRRRPAARASDPELLDRAIELSRRYDLGAVPTSIGFVANQRRRWGSCAVATGAIRLSDRLRHVPGWVLDAVIVHEMAHLVHADHSPSFHELADRHPRQADAARFLDGYQLGLDLADEGREELFDAEGSATPSVGSSSTPAERPNGSQGTFGL